jgi:hypothetical protein
MPVDVKKNLAQNQNCLARKTELALEKQKKTGKNHD